MKFAEQLSIYSGRISNGAFSAVKIAASSLSSAAQHAANKFSSAAHHAASSLSSSAHHAANAFRGVGRAATRCAAHGAQAAAAMGGRTARFFQSKKVRIIVRDCNSIIKSIENNADNRSKFNAICVKSINICKLAARDPHCFFDNAAHGIADGIENFEHNYDPNKVSPKMHGLWDTLLMCKTCTSNSIKVMLFRRIGELFAAEMLSHFVNHHQDESSADTSQCTALAVYRGSKSVPESKGDRVHRVLKYIRMHLPAILAAMLTAVEIVEKAASKGNAGWAEAAVPIVCLGAAWAADMILRHANIDLAALIQGVGDSLRNGSDVIQNQRGF